jgi:phage minor structural protein
MKKIIKISIFPSNTPRDKVLQSNGTVLDNICLSAVTDESIIDGNYTFSGTFLLDSDGLWKEIEQECILKVRMDYGQEVFRIASIRRNRRDIEVVARQITIAETVNLWLDDVRPTDTNGQGALSWLLTNATGVKEIFVSSDIPIISTAYYMRTNMYNAIHSNDNAFMARWGGEVQRRGYNLTINSKIGSDRGVSIRSRKNLTGFEDDTDISKLVTRIKPVGFDGITIDGYVDSPLINNYARVYTKEVKYDDVKVINKNDNEGYSTLAQAQAELIRRAKLEFSGNRVDELRADYRINFVSLDQTEEYKGEYEALERVLLGDTISVHVDKLDVDIKVRALTRKFDVLRQMVKEVTLSNVPLEEKKAPSVNQVLNQLKNQVLNNNNSVADYIQSMINSGNTDSYVVFRPNELLIMDNKDLNAAINVTRYNKHGLGFSQTGYYGEYTYGFTIDGVLNASLIRTGILTAILIQSVSGDCSINLETGEVNFNKGSIKGPGIDISLNNGYVRTFATIAGEIFEVMLSQGGVKSNHSLSVKAQEKMNLESSGNWLYLLCQEGANSAKWSNILMSKDNIIISADGGSSGKVLINGKNGVEINGREITSTLSSIETTMLKSEGII